jgi:hypothetical protein
MDKVGEKVLRIISTFVGAISFLCYENDGKTAANYTLLTASYNGQDTDIACNLLNHYLLADKGIEDVNMTMCIHVFHT